jgi:hypothetical protein
MATYGEPPRISLALWAKALVASKVPAAIATSVLISFIMATSPADLAFIDPKMFPDFLCCVLGPS